MKQSDFPQTVSEDWADSEQNSPLDKPYNNTTRRIFHKTQRKQML